MNNPKIGMVGRFFPANWRLPTLEIEFAARHQFSHLQLMVRDNLLDGEALGQPLNEIAAALNQTGVGTVMELMAAVGADGLNRSGQSALDLFKANLPTIRALGCDPVHWHIVTSPDLTNAEIDALEIALLPQLAEATKLAKRNGFSFGVEHNSPAARLFHHPRVCAHLLAEIPGLNFVWDFNHTHPEHTDGFHALIPHTQMLHISDAPLPETNYHWPLGKGNVPYGPWYQKTLNAGFTGPAILEIGGLPHSGGFEQDTDEALINSRALLLAAL